MRATGLLGLLQGRLHVLQPCLVRSFELGDTLVQDLDGLVLVAFLTSNEARFT